MLLSKRPVKQMMSILLLPFLAAILLVLSFPGFNQGYLAWFALLPLFFYCREATRGRQAFMGGLLTGIIFFLHLYSYMALSVNFLFPPALGIVVVVLASLYSSLFFAFFAFVLYYLLRQERPLITALAAPSLWVLLEWLRSAGLLGHSGGFLGYSQAGYAYLLPIVSTYGYWGLPFLMILFQVILSFLMEHRADKIFLPKVRTVIVPVMLLVFLSCASFTVSSFFTVEEKEESLRIALLQGNIPQENILNPKKAAANFQRYVTLSKEAAERYGPLDLIVWPETVYSLNVARYHQGAAAELAFLAEVTGTPVLFGAMLEDKTSGNVYNSVLLQQPGQPLSDKQRYDKQRLVPFAEYFPFNDLLNRFLKSDVSLGTYTPGQEAAPFQVNSHSIGAIICFESYFPRPALQLARQNMEHLFILTNDAWFLQSHGVQQHADVAPFRAAELGVGVTQVANTGFTRSYNFKGAKTLELTPFQEGSALLETRFPHRQTLYLLWGDYFLLVSAALLAVSIFYIRRTNLAKHDYGHR